MIEKTPKLDRRDYFLLNLPNHLGILPPPPLEEPSFLGLLVLVEAC